MGWASPHIAELRAGRTVSFRPTGRSMSGRLGSGQRCTVRPIAPEEIIEIVSIVLCTVGRAQYLHLVKGVKNQAYQIGNNRGGISGWVNRSAIHGICIAVEP